jgi:hypothetical protein
MRLRPFTSVAVLLLAVGVANAQEKVDNPEFASWSKFKKGTSVTMKSASTAAGNTSEILITTTLVEVGTDKLVVETSSVIKVNGMEIKSPGQKREIMKTVEIPKGVKPEDFKGGKPPGAFEDGTETVKISGGEYKTKWFKTKVEAGGNKTETKMWMSDEVPGMMVKMEANSTGAFASSTKMEVIEIKKP